MPWIENCSAVDVRDGLNHPPLLPCNLIRIADPAGWLHQPKHKFDEVYCFEFLDIEDDDISMEEEWRFSDAQADEIVAILMQALADEINIVCHCGLGVSRSGAVVEFAVKLGFTDPGTFRDPNKRVLSKLQASYEKYLENVR